MPTAPRTFRLTPKTSRDEKRPETIARCRKYRTKAWEQLRMEVIARDGAECQQCGYLCTGKGEAHVDHIVAVVNGGSDESENLRTLCAPCHSRRTAKDNAR